MPTFTYRGPLAPDSPMFRGRTPELARLKNLCSTAVQAYAIVYGGRQTGKTSLLLRLVDELSPAIPVCRVDFQGLPGADTAQVYAYLAQRIARVLPQPLSPPTVDNAPALIEFLGQALDTVEAGQFVLILEELGALPATTCQDLANVLRSIFTNRFDPAYHSLAKLMVILAGSIELYDLAATQVSTLHNICEAVYLPPLKQAEAIDLVQTGLTTLDLPKTEASQLADTIYGHAGGQPYLTQRLGGALEAKLVAGQSSTPTDVSHTVTQLLQGDALLRHMRRGLTEQGLLNACTDLLAGQLRFSRLDEEMARLELLGLAGEQEGYWRVRNPFLSKALQQWAGITIPIPPSPQPFVFISYSHEDETEKNALLKQLNVLQQAGLVNTWSDDQIGPGADWEQEIEQAMAQAGVAILLITANFLTSDFIQNKVVPKLRERHRQGNLIILPIIAKACAWQAVGWLKQMKVRPKNERPVWSANGNHADEDLATIAAEIALIVSEEVPDSSIQQNQQDISEPPITPPAPQQPKTTPKPKSVNTAKIRRLLNTAFSDPDLDAFCQDYFYDIFNRFGRGLQKGEKITLLLDHCRRTPGGFAKLLGAIRSECEADTARQEELGALLFELERIAP